MANAESVGRTSAKFEMEVERGNIREFARATFSNHPAYLASAQPVIPPTFLTTQVLWHDDSSEPWTMAELDISSGLHAEEEYIFHGPLPRAGDKLVFQTTIEDMYGKPGGRGGDMTFVVAVTRYWNQEGTLIAEARTTAVETTARGQN